MTRFTLLNPTSQHYSFNEKLLALIYASALRIGDCLSIHNYVQRRFKCDDGGLLSKNRCSAKGNINLYGRDVLRAHAVIAGDIMTCHVQHK
jgi:hypothetical protein